ncbi:hypothetical protein CI238_00255 [Colletotrichum incanum]|uniref:Uncharacterized protein n=1 Tax=Colletotrichum incanum TaxID=1573173 RepID=A0A166QV12_COLIC|nr:hypothetical protein CI238_00255 [Colletotrichum incanum]OHW93894.1 hypothetical protein CSPAE12_07620 [Colletotrichum incanum]
MNRTTLMDTLASAQASPRRPILTLVNGDNTWLISVPRPASTNGKAFYHILQDPWLGGPSDALSRWFLRLHLKEEGALGSLKAVEDWIQEVETACGGTNGEHERWLDAVLVTHTNTDHLHEPTLRTFDPSINLFAVEDAAAVISAMKHFQKVSIVPDFVRGEKWPTTPGMPEWLSVFRLQDESGMYPNLYHAMIIGMSAEEGNDEVILYTPHGVEPEMVEAARKANPNASVLAMLHPLNECGLGITSKGVANGLKIERQNTVRHWVNTHDDNLRYGGIMSYFMQHGRKTLEQGLEEEAKEKGAEQRRPNYVVVENGGSHILT